MKEWLESWSISPEDMYYNFMDSQLRSQAAWYDLHNMARARSISKRLMHQFNRMQKPLGATCFLEIGAHEASFSVLARDTYPEGIIAAFEANPHVHKQYQSELAAKGIDYLNMAVGDYTGTTDFLLATRIDGEAESLDSSRNSILARAEGDNAYQAIQAPITSLNDFVMDRGLREETFCLWIDAEGASRQVLKGAEAILPKTASLLLELELSAVWQGQWTSREAIIWLRKRNFIPVLRDFPRQRQYNCIFVNQDWLPRADYSIWRYIQDSVSERLNYLAGK